MFLFCFFNVFFFPLVDTEFCLRLQYFERVCESEESDESGVS